MSHIHVTTRITCSLTHSLWKWTYESDEANNEMRLRAAEKIEHVVKAKKV